MNGQVLCNLGKERFLELAPDFVGDILWEHLEQMIKGMNRGREACWQGAWHSPTVGSQSM